VHFFDIGTPTTDTSNHCKACGSSDLEAEVQASQKSIFAEPADCQIIYYRCKFCGSLNEFSESSGYYESRIDPAFANYYVDVGAGVEEIIDPLARLSRRVTQEHEDSARISYLELGCGYGFGVHYANSIQGWDAAGIEPGGYGAIGKRELGITIHTHLLGQGSPLDGSLFDILYASEVIEHIGDPEGFLKTAAKHLKEDGTLILTTPSADFISKDNSPNEVYAALFPGEHKIILSEEGACALLHKSGLQHIRIEKRTPANIVIQASKREIPDSLYCSAEDTNHSRDEAIRYLRLFGNNRDKSIPQASARLRLAMTTRLIKTLTNAGQISAAAELIAASTPELIQCLEIKSLETLISNSSEQKCAKRIIPKPVFTASLMSIAKENILTTIGHQPYPRDGIAFAKNLGFYACIIVLNHSTPASSDELRDAGRYLETFIDHALEMHYSPESFYFIEFISMLGPALTCLLLIRIRLGLSPELNDFPIYNEGWFAARYPSSHRDIIGMLENKRHPQGKVRAATQLTQLRERIKCLSRKYLKLINP
jgi:SAM-dependent methyltransferase